MTYKRLHREKVDQWVKGLLSKKEEDQWARKEFLGRVLSNDHEGFVDYVESGIANGGDSVYVKQDGQIPTLAGSGNGSVIQLQPGHMYLMPAKDIATLYRHWKDIPDGEAADKCVWGAVTLSEIREKRIKPCWLAVDNRNNEDDAKSDLDRAINDSDARHTDRMVRRVLRWMTAPGNMRGGVELYANCSLAKAWWCGRLAYVISEQFDDVAFEDANQALNENWLGLADYLAGRLTAVGELTVLCGIVLWLKKHTQENSISRKRIEEMLRRLGEISSWRVLGVQEPAQVLETITVYCHTATTTEAS